MSGKSRWKLAKWVFVALMCTAGFSWVFGAVYSQRMLPALASTEFPLGDLQNAAVDSDGNVYCAVGFYRRIQKYDARGQFERAWEAPVHGGMFWVDVDAHDRVYVWSVYGQWFAFDQAGNRIDPHPEDLDPSSPVLAESEGRSTDEHTRAPYAVRGRWINPRVVKIDAHGNERTVVSSPLYLWPLMGPMPAILEFVVGLLGLGVCKFMLHQVYGPDSPAAAAQPGRGVHESP